MFISTLLQAASAEKLPPHDRNPSVDNQGLFMRDPGASIQTGMPALATALTPSFRSQGADLAAITATAAPRAWARIADSGGSRPRIRDDLARHSDLMSLGVPR